MVSVPQNVLTQYNMQGQLIAAPFTFVYWTVYNTPDYLGLQSGYSGQLQNISIGASYSSNSPTNNSVVPTSAASGDLSHQYPNPTVVGITNIPVNPNNIAPTVGQVLALNSDGYLEWTSAGGGSSVTGSGLWYSVGGNLHGAAVPLSGDLASQVTLGQTHVTGIQSFPVSTTTPGSDGFALVSTGGVYVPTGVKTVYNVKNFGAKGDGVTDDTAAIQTALNTVPRNSELFFPPGQYLQSSPLIMSTGITMSGPPGPTGGSLA